MTVFNKNSILSLFILVGTIVGAGLFGFPYVVLKSGVLPAIFYFIILGGLMILLHLFFGEVFLRTKEDCRLVGLARKYLGKWWGRLAMLSVFIGITGALLAYIILSGELISTMLSSKIEVEPFIAACFSSWS
jgi:amino acid permease